MKCAACGYEFIRKTETVDKVVYYQSGKRKGEIKEITTEDIEFVVGGSDFINLYFKKDVDVLGYDTDKWYDRFNEVDLYACPECGTLKVKI